MDQQKFDQLKQKYSKAIEAIHQQNIKLEHLHEDGGKLVIQGAAPSEDAKNAVWNAIKAVDTSLSDVNVDLKVDSSLQPAAPAAAQQSRKYTVKAGDSLSKISQEVYGSASQYMKIFEANRDQLDDPNKIKAGQELNIPQ